MSSIYQTVHLLCKHVETDITPRNGWLMHNATKLEELEKNHPCMFVMHILDTDKSNIYLSSNFRTWLGMRNKSGIINPENLLGYICPNGMANLNLYFHNFRISNCEEYTHSLRIAPRGQSYQWMVACSAKIWRNENRPLVVLTVLKPIEELLTSRESEATDADKFSLAVYETLPARKRQVLRLLAKGMSDAQAARELNISKLTIKTYRQELRRKFKVQNTVGLVACAAKIFF